MQKYLSQPKSPHNEFVDFSQLKKHPPQPTHTPSLSLAFSSSSSSIALVEFFQSERKHNSDPEGFVKPRSMSDLFDLAREGQIATVCDDRRRIQAICVAYPFSVQIKGQSYSVTEIGTVLSCIKGKGLSELTIAALAQKIKASNDNDHRIVAKVAANNRCANKFFAQKLGWDLVKAPETIKEYYTSDMGKSALQDDHSELKNWYSYGSLAALKSSITLAKASIQSSSNPEFHLDI